MENKVILTQEELNELTNLQESLNNLIINLGQTEFQIYNLEKYKNSVKNEIDNINKKQEELSQLLSSKYGDGTINIETGEFTSVS
jgi:hypothetical protein